MGRIAKSPSDRESNTKTILRVDRDLDLWVVRQANPSRMLSTHSTKADAVSTAQRMLRKNGGELRILGKNGRLTTSTTLGRQAMANISAVEGIQISTSVKKMLRKLDKYKLTNDEKRESILVKYGSSKLRQ